MGWTKHYLPTPSFIEDHIICPETRCLYHGNSIVLWFINTYIKKNTGLGLDSRKRLAVAYAVNNLEKVLLEVFFNIGMYLQPVFDYEPSWKSFSWSYGSSQLGSGSSLLKGKHCQKPHYRNRVVDHLEHWLGLCISLRFGWCEKVIPT